MKVIKLGTICLILAAALVGCGGGGTGTTGGNPIPQGKLVDPSGNWKQSFVDASGNTFILSALYNQVGAVVTGINFSEVGNGPNATPPTSFNCAAQRDIAMANGLVANVNQFSGDLSGNFGGIHFTSILNDAGTHAAGTYTLTPGANGNCLGIALTGTFVGDEVPSMSGNWTGTVTCVLNCPTGSTTGAITMSLTQDDATGTVTGSYTISGVPGISSGTVATGKFDLLSGASLQLSMLDQNGIININNVTAEMVGGPVTGLGTAGLGLDRSFHGNIATGGSGVPLYAVSMSH
jgi:hypothetical protein